MRPEDRAASEERLKLYTVVSEEANRCRDIVNEPGAFPTQQLLSADADVTGAEIEFTFRPLPGLQLEGGVGWLDSEFTDFTVQKRLVQPTKSSKGSVGTFVYDGNPLIAAPELNATGAVEYELPLFQYGSLVPRFDFSYKSRTYLDPTFEKLISQPSYWRLNARLAYRTPNGQIEIAGWVRNFLD